MNAPVLSARARLTRALARVLVHGGLPGASIALRNAYKLLGRGPAGPLRVPTIYGFDMQLDPRRHRGVDASVYFNGTYEAGSIDVIRRALRPGDVFIDAGANIGLMSLAAAQIVGPGGQVHAFEPVPEVHAILEANAALNGYRQIRAHRRALGAGPETRTIYEQAGINKGSASLVEPSQGTSASHAVAVTSVDAFVREAGISRVRMLKADVEGWEFELLQGARAVLSAATAPALCIEYSRSYSPRSGQLMDVYEFLRSVNAYQIFKLRFGKETVSQLVPIRTADDLPRHDNIFCFLPDHLEAGGLRTRK